MAKEIWTADCETAPFGSSEWDELINNNKPVHKMPFIWGIYNGCDYYEFNSTEKFVEFIKNINGIIYAHNGGKFDWHFIINEIEQHAPLMIIAGRIAKFSVGTAELRDSYNILPMPLSAYKKDDFDYSLNEIEKRNIPENKIKISNYLRADCVYLHEVVSRFIEQYGLNLTVAGTAMKQWRKISKQKAPVSTQLFYESLAPYYYGGRVECFTTGEINKEFKVIDINSAYPDAMMRLHPYGTNYTTSDELPKTRAYIERTFIRLRCVSRGAFPYREKTGLAFPNDNIVREYFVTGHEYLAAVDTNTARDIEIISVLQFNDSIEFSEYVSHFYELKDRAKIERDRCAEESSDYFYWHCQYIYAKLFLNSLYGKFAANPDKYKEHTVIEEQYINAAIELDDYNYCCKLGKWALMAKELPDEKKTFYNVAVAASITGSVRAKLWRAICESEQPLYCDTDSIACVDTGTIELDAHKLGAWDIEAACDYGGIAGKKLYAFRTIGGKWKTASKGVRLTPDELIRVAKGETVRYTPFAPSFSISRGIHITPRNVKKLI